MRTDQETALYKALSYFLDQHDAEPGCRIWFPEKVWQRGFGVAKEYEKSSAGAELRPAAGRTLLIISLPKSGTMFFQRSLEATLGVQQVRISCPGGNVRDDIDAEALFSLYRQPRGYGGDHVPASPRNIELLRMVGADRIGLIVRDPRDALVSWWRHLEREDHKTAPWRLAHLASCGLSSANYYEMSSDDQFADLVVRMFPAMQEWLAGWAQAMDRLNDTKFHLIRYEDFVTDQTGAVRSMCRFFDYNDQPVLPPREGKTEHFMAGIHTFTHYRRGKVGSHRDELSSNLLSMLNAAIDPAVFERYGWSR